jgi:tetratricopeptide (TPR) repeat protein
MYVRRTILCLAAAFLWATYDPDVASGQESELREAYNSYKTLNQQGRYSDAEPYAKKALRLGTEEFGPNDPTTAVFLNNLALLYYTQGRYAEAEPLHRRALAIREKALGPEHPDVAQSLNNLAGLYQAQGRYAEVEPLYQRALAIREKALGPEHTEVATSLNNLAGLYYSDQTGVTKRTAIQEGQKHDRD